MFTWYFSCSLYFQYNTIFTWQVSSWLFFFFHFPFSFLGSVRRDPVASESWSSACCCWLRVNSSAPQRTGQRRQCWRMCKPNRPCIHASSYCPCSPVLSFGGHPETAAGVSGHMDQGAWLGSLWGMCSGRNPLHSRPGTSLRAGRTLTGKLSWATGSWQGRACSTSVLVHLSLHTANICEASVTTAFIHKALNQLHFHRTSLWPRYVTTAEMTWANLTFDPQWEQHSKHIISENGWDVMLLSVLTVWASVKCTGDKATNMHLLQGNNNNNNN